MIDRIVPYLLAMTSIRVSNSVNLLLRLAGWIYIRVMRTVLVCAFERLQLAAIDRLLWYLTWIHLGMSI
jgi:hypothetical protein